MTARLLPPEEWGRLAGTELGPVYQHLDPAEAHIVVVEDAAGAIVGCWSAFPVWHLEGVWIAPAQQRRGVVARRLLRQVADLLRAHRVTRVLTGCVSAHVARLLHHLGGTKLPGDQYVLEVENLCQPPSLSHSS